MIDNSPSPNRFRYTLPRWLSALSVAVGLGLPFIVLIQSRGMAGASVDEMLLFMVMTIILNIGYILAPFLIGRGQWQSFFAGLALGPSLAGWVLMFLPDFVANPQMLVLAGVSAIALIGDYAYIFRHFAAEFFSNRKGGGPG